MRKFLSGFKRSSGFTLIELLVVIGILGVLAAALIATIDPFEQLKKAQDANVKNTVVEFSTANIRYYTTHNLLPWSDPNQATCEGAGLPSGELLTTARMTSCLNALVSDGELKSGFTTVTSILANIKVTGGTNTVVTCFAPQSKSQQRDPNTTFNADGTSVASPTTNCVGYGGGTTCYWCAK